MNTKINRGYFPVVLLSYDEICGRLYYNIVISKTIRGIYVMPIFSSSLIYPYFIFSNSFITMKNYVPVEDCRYLCNRYYRTKVYGMVFVFSYKVGVNICIILKIIHLGTKVSKQLISIK